ncbi:MAG: hypothetical protein HC831_32240 [Chloroflexia bacterium]|nr:hypothetical protein [Chloroflexia bacterium]
MYNYFAALNDKSFSDVLKYVDDSIFISEYDYVLARSINDLRTNFQWDSVLNHITKLLS